MQTLTKTHTRRFLCLKEVAERLRVHPATARRMIADGRIPAIQLGGPGTSIRVDPADLDRWLYHDGAAT